MPPESATALSAFLQSLIAEGRPRVSTDPPDDPADRVEPLLGHLEARARADSGLDCPEWHPAAALWAARLFYHLCQFTVCRAIDEARIVEVCQIPCPTARGPQTDWSVDLVLRHLPALCGFAAHLSPGDPLVREMRQLAAAWPLSSVGIPGLPAVSLDSFIGHPALKRLYADRIVESGDQARVGDPRVDDQLRADLGLHRELAPALASRLILST